MIFSKGTVSYSKYQNKTKIAESTDNSEQNCEIFKILKVCESQEFQKNRENELGRQSL